MHSLRSPSFTSSSSCFSSLWQYYGSHAAQVDPFSGYLRLEAKTQAMFHLQPWRPSDNRECFSVHSDVLVQLLESSLTLLHSNLLGIPVRMWKNINSLRSIM
mmetsp:Transcript_22618/g.56183  ORF Transcript_22618/g.56183 Transcript_22618/m.56183 type:complete len:102 (-) Transcript_22618:169-474(-)